MTKKIMITGAIVTATVLGAIGASAFNAVQTFAANDVNLAVVDTKEQKDLSGGGHVGTNGTKEELLTGTTAEKVTTAALAAVTGGTVQRVETDAEGAVYEAHMTKSDGSRVTVKLDASFKVTSTEPGMR